MGGQAASALDELWLPSCASPPLLKSRACQKPGSAAYAVTNLHRAMGGSFFTCQCSRDDVLFSTVKAMKRRRRDVTQQQNACRQELKRALTRVALEHNAEVMEQ